MPLYNAPKGQWQLTKNEQGYTGGNITIDTSFMKPAIWYSLMAVMTSTVVNDSRISYAELFIYVSTESTVPGITMK